MSAPEWGEEKDRNDPENKDQKEYFKIKNKLKC